MRTRLAAACVVLTLPATGVGAEEEDGFETWRTAVKPLLVRRCGACHGPVKQEGGLRVDAAQFLRKGGDSGAVIVAGKPDESPLIQAVRGEGFVSAMPAEGRKLTAEEIQLLAKWVREGAQAPREEEVPEHWAFLPPTRPKVPRGGGSVGDVRNAIDAFVNAKLAARGLEPLPEADRRTLLRRVWLDLAGVPPRPEDVAAFLADERPDAYERVVDELLESPLYAERWARHWMDVWRYSDWYGYKNQLRNSAKHIWHWRDWIVESLEEDAPYDRMVREMLAADELHPGDVDRLRATGFLARNYYKFNRTVWLDDTIEHSFKAFLGLTINCARCHDHPYDPITQREYYRVRAIFEPHRVRTDPVPGETDTGRDGVPIAYDADLEVKTFLFERGNEKAIDEDDPLSPGVPAFVKGPAFDPQAIDLPAEGWYPGVREYVRRDRLAAAEAEVAAKVRELDAARKKLQAAQRQAKATEEDAAPVAAETEPFVADDFDALDESTWEVAGGEWSFRDGKAVQAQVAKSRQMLATRKPHPRDFTAEVRFRTTGGTTYKSVGLSFDVRGERHSSGVYASGHAPGPKVQVTLLRDGKRTYGESPSERPVALNRDHVLRVDVRDRLLNVTFDGELQFAYTLPDDRRAGRFGIWTFDATAEFDSVTVRPLAADATLVEAGTQAPSSAADVDVLEADVRVKEAVRELEESRLAALRARIAADRARFGEASEERKQELAREASRLERIVSLKAAESVWLGAQRRRLAAKNEKERAAAEKAIDAAEKKLAAARKAAEEESESYEPLGETYTRQSTGRRAALARWITDPRNPLFARVAVNHVWTRHIGEPLVPTVFDFGTNGKEPTHGELLDWLAVEFVESGWSQKRLHRLIVTSAAYRRSSSTRGAPAANVESDPDNVYLWRAHHRRMESEVVRDSVLWVAGVLDLKRGGPELGADKAQGTFRRSLYYRHAPEKFSPFLKLFDAASTDECYRRNETVVPQQALAMMNSPLVAGASRRLAAKIAEETAADDAAYVERLFETVLCRPPTSAERETCGRFLEEQAARLGDASSLQPAGGSSKADVAPAGDPRQRAREGLAHVLLNHNEFVTRR